MCTKLVSATRRVLLGDIERLTDYIQQFRLLAAETRKRWHVVTTTARTANHDSRAESIAEASDGQISRQNVTVVIAAVDFQFIYFKCVTIF